MHSRELPMLQMGTRFIFRSEARYCLAFSSEAQQLPLQDWRILAITLSITESTTLDIQDVC